MRFALYSAIGKTDRILVIRLSIEGRAILIPRGSRRNRINWHACEQQLHGKGVAEHMGVATFGSLIRLLYVCQFE
jgi:hypothetical protein